MVFNKITFATAVLTARRVGRRIATVLLALPIVCAASDGVTSRALSGTELHTEFDAYIPDRQAAQLRQWIEDNAAAVAAVHGSFPTRRLNVIVRSAYPRGAGDAVTFGRTTRRNGGTVELFINPARPIAEFYADWTAMHEFSHLLLPLLDREDRWISEGFASYYQNVLMARMGQYSSDEAWRRLAAGFERGSASLPELSPAAAARRGVRGARMKYYWAGAALALLADVELRRQSSGRQSLDSVLGDLHDCCLPARRLWSARKLFRLLDNFAERPVFMPLYREYAHTVGFPDAWPVLEDPQFGAWRNTIINP